MTYCYLDAGGSTLHGAHPVHDVAERLEGAHVAANRNRKS